MRDEDGREYVQVVRRVLIVPGRVAATMEDAVYYANVLRSRECAVCGTDRKASVVLSANRCAVCDAILDDGHAVLAIAKGAAKAVCSYPCLEVVLNEGLAGGEACPACGTLWSAAAPHARACRSCAKALSFDDGYIGLWQGGRVLPFCGLPCLEMHDARVNPVCG